jgi:sulfate adenylyltransferase large subunit
MTLDLEARDMEAPDMGAPDIDAFLRAHERKSLLRFITCGSVDDGKSTLIGRLLHESDAIFEDQLRAVEAASRQHGTPGQPIDLALVTDGLAAEREQGITIDVAYRYFATARRKFIIADTPGHEQYTRNMATGASTADLAILLVDARKGAALQTRRHALIVSLIGVKHVIVAVNKMDLTGWSEDGFRRIEAQIRGFAESLAFESLSFIPLSALTGENVAAPGSRCPWFAGPTLLAALEAAEPSARPLPFRMAVQWVNRASPDFRGYCGLVSSGGVAVGDPIAVQPFGGETRVTRILGAGGEQANAVAGQSVTLVLADAIDISRGDLFTPPGAPAQLARVIDATLLWMDERPARQGADYLVKIGARSVIATLSRIRSRIDPATLDEVAAERFDLNDIGQAELTLDQTVALDLYHEDRSTGGFILIDRESFDTVGMGLVRAVCPENAGQRVHPLVELTRRWSASTSESSLRSLFKAATWRLCGSLATTILAFLFTGSLKLSMAIGGAEFLTKIVLYCLHERLWTGAFFGKNRSSGNS